jgi:hypothetical protein
MPVRRVLVLVFWCGVFLVFLTPLELGDLWWHLGTGKWIWQHNALPGADPFSISSTGSKGEAFVLGGFWLCQLAMYGAERIFGPTGLIALKAAAFTFTFLLAMLTLKSFGLKPPVIYMALVPAIFLATYFDEIRPQSISFLFFALTLYLLELERGPGGHGRLRPYMLLVVIMPAWANMHPGFVIGDLVIAAYMLEKAVRPSLWKAPSMPARFILFSLAAVALSALNPNGLEAIERTLRMVVSSISGTSGIHEHAPIREFSAFTQQRYLYPAVVAFITAGLMSFIIRLKKPDVFHLLLFCALSSMAIITFRAGLFFAIAGTVVIGRNLSGLRQPDALRRPIAQWAAGCALLFMIVAVLLPRTIIRKPVMDGNLFPLKASAFIEEAAFPGNLYHPYEWGGYLIWRLYPKYKVFMDGRALGPMKKHREVLAAAPSWDETLRKYGINTVLYWPLLPYEGSVPPLLFALLGDEGWSPVYWDLQCVVFVRSDLADRPLRKTTVRELWTSLITSNILANPGEARNYTALGEAYLNGGLRIDAKRAFEKALALNPEDRKAALWLKALESSP